MQNAFAHEHRALIDIGADGTDVRQLLVNMYYDTFQKKSQDSCRLYAECELSHKIMEVHVSSKNTIPAFQPRSKRAKEQLREAIVLESERQQYH